MNLERKVAEAIASHRMASDGATLAVALSGGADSVALLAALNTLGYNCHALHCNFHLRGEESQRDENHARNVARCLGVPISVKHIDVKQWRDTNGGSIEMACRESRYEWFEKMRQQLGAEAVAVGHNSSDSVETFFINLLRGSSSAGLKGIAPVRGNIIRPLLGITRTEIEQYLALRGLDAITDSSNLQNEYRRNKLRNIIIPALENEFPGATDRIAASMQMLAEDAAFIDLASAELIKPFIMADGSIDLTGLKSHPQARMLLFQHLKPLGFNHDQVADILKSADSTGAMFHAGEHTIVIDRQQLKFARQEELKHIKLEILPITEFNPSRNPRVAYFAPEVMEGEPLKIRAWQLSDRLKPFGMSGSRLVSDILSDAKIPRHQKHTIPLLVKGDDILWVAGLRASRLFKVDPTLHSSFVLASIDD